MTIKNVDEDDLNMLIYKRKNLNSCMILTNTVNASSSGICSCHDHGHGQEHDHDDDQIMILNHDFPPA